MPCYYPGVKTEDTFFMSKLKTSAVVKLKYWVGVIWPTLLSILQHHAKILVLFSFHGKH